MQAYVLIGIFMRRARRTTFGMSGSGETDRRRLPACQCQGQGGGMDASSGRL